MILDAPPELPDILAEPHLLELALVNLATNARDAMPKGGTFSISLDKAQVADANAAALKAGDYLRISASDTGCGMNETTVSRATEPLFTTKAGQSGTGLGLSMIRDFITQAGGAMQLRSAEGKGTLVDIWLPALP